LLNASVGVTRVLGRLRRPHRRRTSSTWAFRSHPVALDPTPGQAEAVSGPVRRKVSRTWAYRRWRPPFAAFVGRRVNAAAAASQLLPFHRTHRALLAAGATEETRPARRRSLTRRLGHDRALAVAVAGILLVASVVSVSAGQSHASKNVATGGTDGAGTAPRLVVAGAPEAVAAAAEGNTGDVAFAAPQPPATESPVFAAIDFGDESIEPDVPTVDGPFIDDGTLVKPIAVDTNVPDGSALVRTYKVKNGDNINKIASRFKVSTMSVVWANNLKSKTDLHTGEVLRIPPVTGLIVQVSTTDTLASLAAEYNVNKADILATNGLDDPNLIVGQVLVIPGAAGQPLPETKPVVRTTRPSTGGGGGGGTVRGPSTYRGGKMLWPVVGGGNYISQYFHYGHWAIDIAADYGSKVVAAAAGTVIFAGWKNNGGGYQVWIAHGSGLYTTYNHMSAITVARGQSVRRGQQVGRIGMTGNATGPHLHFEVWRGMVWDGGQRMNPLLYL
jgi:murein DD-endopeptidase MepM/ murein hydrolase activator NlpD